MRQLAFRYGIGAGAVFAIALALRLPFASDYLWAWDSVLYARAMESFNVSEGRPHPPGYVFYVLIARLATTLAGDANAGLVLVSMVGGAAACAIAFIIGSRLFGTSGGILAATSLAVGPLPWHYSEIAYPYTVLALLGGAIGGFLWWTRSRPSWGLFASLAFGIAAGFRQDLLLVLGPLWLWATIPRGPRGFVAAALAVGLGSLTWFVPTVLLSGGLERYLSVTGAQALGIASVGGPNPQSVPDNIRATLYGLRWQLHWLLPLAPLGAFALLYRRRSRSTLWPLALWIAPALATYAFFHIGEWAYTLSVAVPLALFAAAGGAELMRAARPRLLRVAAVATIAVALAANTYSFVYGEGRFTAEAVEGHDRGLAIRLATLREHFPASETILIAEGGYLHARYYLPEYQVYYLPPGASASRRQLPRDAAVRRAVLFLGETRVSPRTTVRRFEAASGVQIVYIPLERRDRLVVVGRTVSVEAEQ